jgi:hypothetical protein
LWYDEWKLFACFERLKTCALEDDLEGGSAATVSGGQCPSAGLGMIQTLLLYNPHTAPGNHAATTFVSFSFVWRGQLNTVRSR